MGIVKEEISVYLTSPNSERTNFCTDLIRSKCKIQEYTSSPVQRSKFHLADGHPTRSSLHGRRCSVRKRKVEKRNWYFAIMRLIGSFVNVYWPFDLSFHSIRSFSSLFHYSRIHVASNCAGSLVFSHSYRFLVAGVVPLIITIVAVSAVAQEIAITQRIKLYVDCCQVALREPWNVV